MSGIEEAESISPPSDISLSPFRREPLPQTESAANILVCQERDNAVRWRPGERLYQLFEQRCDLFSQSGDTQHLAVIGDDRSWSYGELDGRANQLARYLKQQGLGAGDIIGLLFDKSVHSYVSMLAVLKIHAAYIPLDPGFPRDRIAFIAGDAGLRAILTLSRYRTLGESAASAIICVDEAAPHIDAQPRDRLNKNNAGAADELCYIIYTSGSTGRPKGVPIGHAAICNFVRVAAEVYGYQSTDRVYQGLTLAFDFAVEEIWVPLVLGATLVPNQTGSSLLGQDLTAFLRTRNITAMCCVPTLLATLDEPPPDLRLLIVSGEACPGDLIARWHHPQRTILNAYGPTETTVTATLATLNPYEPVTIGRPLPTYSIVILVPHAEQALPFGEAGEIGIAGIGVAQGYLNRDEQTRKAFIHDFLNIPNNPSGRIYRTGDLGRVNERGEIEYLGRIDSQVKIRGYRIELTEIESVILRIPQVAQAVATVVEPIPGVSELAAYYTLRAGAQNLYPEDIARELRAMLPSYMVPTFYEQMTEIPMLASDKADRKSLPPPSGVRMNTAGRAFVAPRGKLETSIAGILAGLLKLDKVSAEDDFFEDLGANSLLMAQFGTRLRNEVGIADCSMRELYLHPSVRKLSTFLESAAQRREPLRRNTPCHVATNGQYLLCGALQLALMFGWIYYNAFIWWEGYEWILEARGWQSAYARAVAFAVIAFTLAIVVPVAFKWLLIGRWKAEEFPVWSLKYLRFWTVKQLVRINPVALFAGTPIYVAYLKLLGARVSWKAAVFSPNVPVCTDLVSIADGALISKNVAFSGYRAESGRIKTGSITLGSDSYVGEGTVLDIDTIMEAGSELAHASSLHAGQRLAAGRSYHGSPAQPTDSRYRRLKGGPVNPVRMIIFLLSQLAPIFLLYTPLPFMVAHYFFGVGADNPTTIAATLPESPSLLHLPEVLWWTTLIFFSGLIFGLVSVIAAPRVLNLFLKAEKIYPLYGIHYFLHRAIERLSNAKFYNVLFGDSSFIVHYLRAIGYTFKGLVQTGSNFGQSQRHDNPFQCEIGKGTMVSDGLAFLNTDFSTSTFRISKVRIGADNFLGNSIFYPPQGTTGNNCLLGTKVMVPTDGPLRENVGLLGSPCFEIPRSVRRDNQFHIYKNKNLLRQRLNRKNVSNTVTMLLFLLSNCIALNLAVVAWFYTYPVFNEHGPLYLAVLAMSIIVMMTPYFILVDWASLGFRRLQPQFCSIYDDYFWKHERHWKLGMSTDQIQLGIWNGTPFKNLVWRALGVRVGKKLFDDGCSIPEKTLTAIGDYCTLNEHCTLQAHSLEDGSFKSDRIFIGDRCTIGANCYVHYGVHMGDDANLEPDSFLMKGERPAARSSWQGNPAREMFSKSAKTLADSRDIAA